MQSWKSFEPLLALPRAKRGENYFTSTWSQKNQWHKWTFLASTPIKRSYIHHNYICGMKWNMSGDIQKIFIYGVSGVFLDIICEKIRKVTYVSIFSYTFCYFSPLTNSHASNFLSAVLYFYANNVFLFYLKNENKPF